MDSINYKDFVIRVYIDENSCEKFYCLSDVCKIMGNSNTSVNKKLLDNYFSEEDKVFIYRVLDVNRKNTIFINNECLLILVCKSRKKSSRDFRKFVISLLGG